jgi:hypothetical protein
MQISRRAAAEQSESGHQRAEQSGVDADRREIGLGQRARGRGNGGKRKEVSAGEAIFR